MIDDTENTLTARISRVLVPALIFAVGFSMMFGAMGAGAASFQEHGFDWFEMLIIVPVGLIGAGIMIWTFRKWPTLQMGEPDTPRTRRLGIGMIGLIAFSAVVAMFFIVPDGNSIAVELYSNDPLPTNLAVGAGLLWLIGLPIISYFHRRNADEVTLEQQRFGETIGFQFFAVVAPAWWLGFRGGVLPQPDIMIVFVAVLAVSWIANMSKRLS